MTRHSWTPPDMLFWTNRSKTLKLVLVVCSYCLSFWQHNIRFLHEILQNWKSDFLECLIIELIGIVHTFVLVCIELDVKLTVHFAHLKSLKALSLCNQDLDEKEIMRCIQVGFLCVQESARSRPSMPSVVSMLNSEIVDLPTPNKPAFIDRHVDSYTGMSSQLNQGKCSINNASITSIDGP